MKPKHVAIILDGNRRFAKRLMLEPWKGHEYGEKKVEELIDWCIGFGVKELTIYTFSIQNFNRPKREFNYLMVLIKDAFKRFLTDMRVKKYGIKVNILGRYTMFPKDVVESLNDVIKATKNNKGFILNFAMAYGGREELTDAFRIIAQKVKNGKLNPEKIDEKIIEASLYNASEPDIIIRTGGEKRTSNFLMWQSYYSELFFIDKTWPEFTKQDLIDVLKEFEQRERRFGR